MNKKLKEIKKENIIVIIYFILLFIYLHANIVEINYIKYHNEKDKEKYRMLIFIVFGISFIITLYYVIDSIKELQECESKEINKLKGLSAIANIIILIATGIYLYIIYKDKDINLEVSP